MTKHLNKIVANLSLFYTKLHNYHWNVEGKHFFRLHTKFEELYDDTHERLDEIAERVLQLGGRPVGTLKDALNLATLKEASDKPKSGFEMTQIVVDDLKHLVNQFKEGIALADEASDVATSDILTGAVTHYEKEIWLLSAFLK